MLVRVAEGNPVVPAPDPPADRVTTEDDAVKGSHGSAATVDASQGAAQNEVLGDGSAQTAATDADKGSDQEMAQNEVIKEGANEEAKKEVLP